MSTGFHYLHLRGFMKKILVSSVFAASLLFSAIAFSADNAAAPATPAPAATPAAAPATTSPATPATADKKPETPQGISTNPVIADAPIPSDHVLGNKDAKVIMIEYASLSCPHCAHFFNALMPDIQKKYIDTGKIRYILRQYPLNEPALRAAMLVECMGEQGNEKYYLFNKVLFDAQSKWAFDGNWQSALETIAGVGGVSKDQFNACITDSKRETAVLKEKLQAMNELKVPHTPYFYIGGEAYNGEISLEALSKFIDDKIAKK